MLQSTGSKRVRYELATWTKNLHGFFLTFPCYLAYNHAMCGAKHATWQCDPVHCQWVQGWTPNWRPLRLKLECCQFLAYLLGRSKKWREVICSTKEKNEAPSVYFQWCCCSLDSRNEDSEEARPSLCPVTPHIHPNSCLKIPWDSLVFSVSLCDTAFLILLKLLYLGMLLSRQTKYQVFKKLLHL